jgi:hypothetical protein
VCRHLLIDRKKMMDARYQMLVGSYQHLASDI